MQVHRFGLIELKRKLSTSLRLQSKFSSLCLELWIAKAKKICLLLISRELIAQIHLWYLLV